MKKLLLAALLLGSVSVARAQVSATILQIDTRNVAQDFSATSAARATPFPETPESASPSPQPKFLYGGRDDYRWELALAATWLRFRSSAFNSNAVGISTSGTYFTNEWFGIEGNITAVFGSNILPNERAKIATYGAGPKIAWRQRKWEPWLHGIFGGAHEQPQIAGSSRNSYVVKAGGGADYRWNPRLSFRLEGDYLRTGFFHTSQNSFQLAGGIVFHF